MATLSDEKNPGSPDELVGLWRRRKIFYPGSDMPEDITTRVTWLQGLELFCDLRQPGGEGPAPSARCLRDLTREDVRTLARQQGFAGTLEFAAGIATWHRLVDFQPPNGSIDTGALTYERINDEEVMVETGEGYVEHWVRSTPLDARPRGALALQDPQSGTLGFAVRVGDVFMYSRGRKAVLPLADNLLALVDRAATLHEAQDCLDCEVSLGSARTWTIKHSSLPFREGQGVTPVLDDNGGVLTFYVSDLSPSGEAMRRKWTVTESKGDVSEAWH